MTNLTVLMLFLLAVFPCTKLSEQLLQSSHQIPSSNGFDVDSLPGYSVRLKNKHIQILKEKKIAFSADVIVMDKYYFRAAREIDSVDIERGFILARALGGPPIAEPPGCSMLYSIDSTNEYYNKFNTRCFYVKIRGIDSCQDVAPDTSYFQGYFVDIAQGESYELIQIPNSLDFLGDKTRSEVYQMLADNIKLRH
ncbi:MAG: hypothetical protein WBZ48_04665 [Bacteroidota bacterium]